MQNLVKATLVMLLIAVVGLIFTSCENATVEPELDAPELAIEEGGELSEEEISGLRFMREEEKLARDVYDYLYIKYPHLQIFDNISNSEQIHMDALLVLLIQFNIEDPASPDAGVFNNEDLQKLYDDLIEMGNQSAVEALTVGAIIEDVDIRDINVEVDLAKHEEIIKTYELLLCGSRNHFRGFVKNLVNNGETYEPHYATQVEFDAIINADHEACGSI
jgi:hypothetical protein